METTVYQLNEYLIRTFPHGKSLVVTASEEWVDVLINEDEIETMEVLNAVQKFKKICDVKLEDISTESVIKKIYEGGVA